MQKEYVMMGVLGLFALSGLALGWQRPTPLPRPRKARHERRVPGNRQMVVPAGQPRSRARQPHDKAPAWKRWVAQLRDKTPKQREHALKELYRLGNSARAAMPAVLQALKDPSWSIRARAARWLGKIGLYWELRNTCAALQKLTQDSHWRVRVAALDALSAAPPPCQRAAHQAALRAYKDTVWEVQERAVMLLGRLPLQNQAGMRLLRHALRAAAWQVRAAAAWAIAQSDPPIVLPATALKRLLQDPEPAVREQGIRVIARQGIRGLQALKTLRKSPDTQTRVLAIRTLGMLQGAALRSSCVALLKAALFDQKAAVRAAAGIALGKLQQHALPALDALIKRFQDPSDSVRVSAIWASSQIGRAATHSLALALRHPHPKTKLAAARALSALGPLAAPAAPFLIDAMLDKNWRVRREVAWALFRIGPDIRAHTPQTMLPILLNALQDRLWKIRYCIIKTLGHIGPKARIVIGWFGPQVVTTIGALKRLQQDPDPRVRQAARTTLRQLQPSNGP